MGLQIKITPIILKRSEHLLSSNFRPRYRKDISPSLLKRVTRQYMKSQRSNEWIIRQNEKNSGENHESRRAHMRNRVRNKSIYTKHPHIKWKLMAKKGMLENNSLLSALKQNFEKIGKGLGILRKFLHL